MSLYPFIRLKKGKEASLERKHPWVFSGAIDSSSRNLIEGEIVNILTHDEQFIARGYCEIGSIAVRILTFEENEWIDADFWRKKLTTAYKLRQEIGLIREDNTIFRLVHGEGDSLPGLIIDIYDSVAVVQAHTVGIHLAREVISEILLDKTIFPFIKSVYYKSETTLPYKADINFKSGLLGGEKVETIYAQENGIKIIPDIIRGQKTGFFIDQRFNRELLMKYSSGKKVLNMFCYTGGFSLYALKGNANEVVSVDSSSKAIDITLDNVKLNFPNINSEINTCHKAYTEDAFKFLEGIEVGEYDIIILDPPAFAKHRKVVKNALKGYRRLNSLALSKLKQGGILFTFSCSQAISVDQFRQALFTSSLQVNKQVSILHQLTQPADHPISMYHPEGEYLKGFVLFVQ